MSAASKLRNLALVAIICCASLFAARAGLFETWNDSLGDVRMALSPKPSNGHIVFVAADARSLTEIGSWPWSRSVHAALLDRLVDGGAIDVLLDFDFTFPSDRAGDDAFAAALERAGGSTYLAVFEQSADITDGTTRHFNLPLDQFAQRSWPALVNVGTDASGRVRDYPFGTELDWRFVPSAGGLLASTFGAGASGFEINFSLQPSTIPVVSAADLLTGAAPADAIAGKAVIVGASAVELSDQLAVPIHGVISGPLVHALAAETLSRNLVPSWLRAEWVALSLLLQLGLLHLGTRRSDWFGPGGAVLLLATVELSALMLFRTTSLQIPSAMLYPALLSFGFWHVAGALRESKSSLLIANTEAQNTLRLLESVFDDSSDGIVILSDMGEVLRFSASARAIFGTDEQGALMLPVQLTRLGFIRTTERETGTRMLEVGSGATRKLLEFRATKSDVAHEHRRGQAPDRVQITTVIVRDVTQLKDQERDIAYLSNYDERTGALRRGTFLSFLALRLEDRRRTAVFALALDRFKTINVTLGRDVGDALLREVVTRLETADQNLSAVARLGGTSFAVYTEDEVSVSEARARAKAILDEVSRPYRLPSADAHIGVRIGYTIVEAQSETSAASALDHAEDALDAAKQFGAPFRQYDRSAWEKQRRAREIERTMEQALANGEFQLLYQPQHRVLDGALVGAEALIRWNSPRLGRIYPDEFIGIAEATGFIVDLGKWTFERAALDTLTLPPNLMVAVNVSGIQIMRSDFARDVDDVLKRTGLDASRICLELTETVLLASTDSIVETMQDLSFTGITWALDDFGTGFSSMEYLSRMPLEKIKLDKSFTMKLGDDPTARPILHSTSELCSGLGVKLLCEGVETKAQLDVLRAEGCAEAQGYYFGKPMPIDRLVPNARRVSRAE